MARVETTRAVVHTIQTVALTRIGAWMHSASKHQTEFAAVPLQRGVSTLVAYLM